ncbi:MAG: putative lipid II flippase FtsW [Gammaproteobacteria bacterium]
MKKRAKTEKPIFYDRILAFAIVALIVFGLVMVASASIDYSYRQYHTSFHFLIRQAVFLCLALVLSRFILTCPMKKIREMSVFIFLFAVICLVLVLIPHLGHSINGSRRWLGIGSLGMQVSEFAKLAVILYLAGYLVRRNEEVRTTFVGFVKPMCLLGVVALLLLKEPDFGATVVIMTTAMSLMLLSGMRLRNFIVLLALVVIAMSVLAISAPYRVKRLTSFMNPWAHPFDSGYQLTQSLIAFGNGGVFGVGLGKSVQKLFYLPEAYTDFLYAVLAEELGLIGILITFSLYTTVVLRAFFIGRRAQIDGEHYSGYVAYGIGLWLGFQFLVNVGVNAGVLPTKGLTLPLMSYGGSSLLIDCLAIAILFRVDYETRIRQYGLRAAQPYRVGRS